jgi:hypothetical protein
VQTKSGTGLEHSLNEPESPDGAIAAARKPTIESELDRPPDQNRKRRNASGRISRRAASCRLTALLCSRSLCLIRRSARPELPGRNVEEFPGANGRTDRTGSVAKLRLKPTSKTRLVRRIFATRCAAAAAAPKTAPKASS